jgi:hypothetical protein
MADNRRQKLQEHSARQSTGQTSAAAGQAGHAGVSEAAPTESAVEASPTAETVAAEAAQAAAQAAPESVSEFGQFGVPGGPESTESSTEFGAPAAQEAPADEAAAPAAPAATVKLVAGVDFAPPEPIASVLPRIQLTSSQADDLWALVCKRRRSNPNNDADAEVAKEIFAGADLANAVQQALQFYVRDVMFLDIPQFRRRLKTLHNRVTQFLATLPQEHDPVDYFLRRTYTGEIFLKDQLRPTVEKLVELQQVWSDKHGLAAIRNNLAEFQKNIDAASSLLPKTRPRDVAVGNFVRSLAHAWEAATGQWPTSGRDADKNSRQSGPFADFVRAATEMLPPNSAAQVSIMRSGRYATAHRPKAKRN